MRPEEVQWGCHEGARRFSVGEVVILRRDTTVRQGLTNDQATKSRGPFVGADGDCPDISWDFMGSTERGRKPLVSTPVCCL